MSRCLVDALVVLGGNLMLHDNYGNEKTVKKETREVSSDANILSYR